MLTFSKLRKRFGAVQVLDEPFAGLDPVAVQTLADVLRQEADRGAAVLFSSHQLDLVDDICEGIAIVDHGRVVTTGKPDALRRDSRCWQIELQLEGAPPQWLPHVAGNLALIIPWFALGFALYAVAYATPGALASGQQDANSAGIAVSYTLVEPPVQWRK